ncbi:MAG: type II secretion system protein [Planctomycetes bacterium]|nr:type II secretion system protein [Planctomycetota bacterium]
MSDRHRPEGFTLVEVLLVVTIISILASLTIVSVQYGRKFANVKATQAEIQQLAQAAHSYKNNFGDFPPTFFSDPPLGLSTNGIDEGNESLIAHAGTRRKGGPFHGDFSDNRLANSDGDNLSPKDLARIKQALDWSRGNAALLEYCDMWGNPFVYIHQRDYGSRKKLTYIDSKGQKIDVQAVKSDKTGTYQAPTSFQIWSFGPNGKNENGAGDDIASWRD